MSVENDIRVLLRQEPMTVDQLADRLGIPRDMANTITAYEMTDIYEEDDGTLKLLENARKGRVRERIRQEITPEIVEIIKELAGTMSGKKIAEAIEMRTGIRLSRSRVNDVIRENGWKKFDGARKWTPEMDTFILEYCGSRKEKVEALNKEFGTSFTEGAVRDHLVVVRNGVGDE